MGAAPPPYISHKITAWYTDFHIFFTFLKLPTGGSLYYSRIFPGFRPS